MTTFTLDDSELQAVARQISAIPATFPKDAEQIGAKGALNIKNQLQAEAASGGSTRHFSRSISYDRKASLGGFVYEIGPDKGKTQGALGNILYFGTSRTGPQLPPPEGALEAEAPAFTEHLTRALMKAVEA